MKHTVLKLLLFAGLFIVLSTFSAFLRLYNVNWDQNQHQHPDERFLTMVTNDISWPASFAEYLDTSLSPLNPHNKQHEFYVYGTFPVFFTKWVADALSLDTYGGIPLVGRRLSALFDVGTVILVFLLTRQLMQSKKGTLTIVPFVAMFFYAVSAHAIQLSHYYAVDTYVVFFGTLSWYLASLTVSRPHQTTYSKLLLAIFAGIAFGLTIASKISGILIAPFIGLFFLISAIYNSNIQTVRKRLPSFLATSSIYMLGFLPFAYLSVRLAQPYLFADSSLLSFVLNPKILKNWADLKALGDPNGWFPPAVQWITSKPMLFPLKNMVLWGLGPPLGFLACASLVYIIWTLLYWYLFPLVQRRSIKHHETLISTSILAVTVLWIVFLFTYQGTQFAKNMRYFLPIYPFLAVISAYSFHAFVQYCTKILNFKFSFFIFHIACCVFVAIPGIAFMSIYTKPHTRTTASEWIFKNIPAGSSISGEHWDDFLPVPLPFYPPPNSLYTSIEFPLYGMDNEDKWKLMDTNLKKVDYIIMSSNRLYGAIMTYPERYPITFKYYHMLFDGSLGFEKVADVTSRPNIPVPGLHLCIHFPYERYGIIARTVEECDEGISFVDDFADESFTVYDHPRVLVFKKVRPIDYFSVLYASK